ncbi:ATP-binding protein [Azonexus fungiphilus]|uniref:ATP-binding protein n=1 Tax=Azonexus fungiphilus TaxID=146940 RepID=UPI00156ABFB6|nr:ATP-binding protein [Azonexus fungiphilus]NHC05806.1 HAMP domain-containing protein [Azonexus fungiphilus]
MPHSLLARIFLLLALLVLSSTAGWLFLFSHIDAEPRAREAANTATSAVNLIRASLFAAAPGKRPGLFAELSSTEGIRLLPAEAQDEIVAMPESRFHHLLRDTIVARLGPGTRVAAEVNGEPGFWVSFRLDAADDDEFWLALPRERASRSFATRWLSWVVLVVALALLVAWLIASRISRPLKAMAHSARAVGSGRTPTPLPEEGAEEMRALASAFNAMAADLARHEKDRSEVLAGISHDLRTPLTRLRLEAELSVADDAARQGIVADIEQMEAVISQFMDYARTESGEPPAVTDLAALLAAIGERQAALGRALEIDLAGVSTVNIRPKAVGRAVVNLLDNAWKYGGGAVSLKASTVDGEIRIEIADRGPGIPGSETERLKRPFTRLEVARTDVTGTGLGLAIVERIARLHRGRLELLDNPGGGLLARLVLRPD